MAQERLRLRDAAPALQQLRQRGVQTVILAGADSHGIMRGKRVPIAELDHVARQGVALCEVICALPVDELAFLLKSAVKGIAASRGLLATFMAKPRWDSPGSSCHPHLSLREGESDAFHDPAAAGLLDRSALARDWLGEDVVEHCVAMRRGELAAHAAAVTDWETARCLEAL